MVDLIPIGTVNRPANENNASKPAENVQETTRSKQLADQENPMRIERRRSGNRRKNPGDRRRLTSSSRKPVVDRRKVPDRRKSRAVTQDNEPQRKTSSRKGRIIDERV